MGVQLSETRSKAKAHHALHLPCLSLDAKSEGIPPCELVTLPLAIDLAELVQLWVEVHQLALTYEYVETSHSHTLLPVVTQRNHTHCRANAGSSITCSSSSTDSVVCSPEL